MAVYTVKESRNGSPTYLTTARLETILATQQQLKIPALFRYAEEHDDGWWLNAGDILQTADNHLAVVDTEHFVHRA